MKGTATATLQMDADPGRVYSTLADYRLGHPRILPMKYFKRLDVIEGGVGAGTRVRGEVQVFGRTVNFEHVVSEPEPGRRMIESDVSGSSVTEFIVEPVSGKTSVTIRTQFTTEREGFLGRIERWMTAATLQKIYAEELGLLARHVAQHDRA